MRVAPLTWLYRKLGPRYPGFVLLAELQSAYLIGLGAIALFSLYYSQIEDHFAVVLAVTFGLTFIGTTTAFLRLRPALEPMKGWIAGQRGPEQTADAWRAAVELPTMMVRRNFLIPVFIVAGPIAIAGIVVLNLSWTAFLPIFAGAMISLGYAGILHFFALESGMRPVLIDINREVPPRLEAGYRVIPLRVKLLATLPLINVITGGTVAALTGTRNGGAASLGVDVLVAITVAFTISLELTVLLSKSIMRPINDLQEGMDAVRKGRFDQPVQVTSADELGDLGATFNQMIAGLAERERIREAFGTYLDTEVAEYILSEGYAPEGTEVEVSTLFCDVVGFTRFAETAEAREVVSSLNALFETLVPIVARHGGHVDKFVGDGLIAVFGAPEVYEDHADRAVLAAVEMAETVNRGDGALRIGIGVNSGPVIAGSIGGGGRLNFSVIGDTVNVAARVEAETRQTGDPVLITAETQRRLGHTIEVADRGVRRLKGKDERVQLYAPPVADTATLEERAEADAKASAELGLELL